MADTGYDLVIKEVFKYERNYKTETEAKLSIFAANRSNFRNACGNESTGTCANWKPESKNSPSVLLRD